MKVIIYNKNDERIGTLCGCYTPEFYESITKHTFQLWDHNYPNWRNKSLLIIKYDEPQRNMSKKEVAQHFQIPEEYLNEALYKELTNEYATMVVPFESVTMKFDNGEEMYDGKIVFDFDTKTGQTKIAPKCD